MLLKTFLLQQGVKIGVPLAYFLVQLKYRQIILQKLSFLARRKLCKSSNSPEKELPIASFLDVFFIILKFHSSHGKYCDRFTFMCASLGTGGV